MHILLDTHIFLWSIQNSRKLSKTARSKIEEAQEVYVSSASIWEISIKISLKKIQVNIDELIEAIENSGFTELPISTRHAATVSQLKEIHKDPFDRMLIAQAIAEPLIFLTADTLLKDYSDLVEVI